MNIESTIAQKSLFGRFCSFLISPFSQHRWISVAFVLVVATIKKGPYQVHLSGVTVVVPGAWELSFPLRGR